MQPRYDFDFFYTAAKNGNVEELKAAIRLGNWPSNMVTERDGRKISLITLLASEKQFDAVHLLLKKEPNESNINNAIFGFAMADHEIVNELVITPNRLLSAINGYAFSGNEEEVNKFLKFVKNFQESIDAAVFYYTLGDHTDCADRLIKRGASKKMVQCAYYINGKKTIDELNKLDIWEGVSKWKLIQYLAALGFKNEVNILLNSKDKYKNLYKDSAVYGYASTGQVEEVNKLLRDGASKIEACRGYKDGDHKKPLDKLLNTVQYEKQIEKRKTNIGWVILGAIFLTPLSLIVTLPLLIISILNEPIKKVTLTTEKIDLINENRNIWQCMYSKGLNNSDTLKKPILFPKYASKVELLVTKPKLAELNMFAEANFRDITYNQVLKIKSANKAVKEKICRVRRLY